MQLWLSGCINFSSVELYVFLLFYNRWLLFQKHQNLPKDACQMIILTGWNDVVLFKRNSYLAAKLLKAIEMLSRTKCNHVQTSIFWSSKTIKRKQRRKSEVFFTCEPISAVTGRPRIKTNWVSGVNSKNLIFIIIHSKYFPDSDWLKTHV